MKQINRIKQIALSWAICISIGALGAHWLKSQLSADKLESFETGSRYHFYGNIALLFLVFIENHFEVKHFNRIYQLMMTGMILFSGSIYILATKEIHGLGFVKFFGPITPIGGILLILSWILLFKNIKTKK